MEKEPFLPPSVVAAGTCIDIAIAIATGMDWVQSGKIKVVLCGVAVIIALLIIITARRLRAKAKLRQEGEPEQASRRSHESTVATASISISITITTLAVLATMFFAGRVVLAGRPPAGPTSPRTTSAPPTTPSSVDTTVTPITTSATFTAPAPNTRINAGASVAVSGTLSGIGHDTLWLLTKPDAGGGSYYLTDNSPVTTRDGSWSFADTGVGDDSDRGKGITYLAVEADTSCASTLAAAVDTVDMLPQGCTILATRAILVNK